MECSGNRCKSYTQLLEAVLIFIVNNIDSNWCEVSNMFYLFHNQQKWNLNDTRAYIEMMSKYIKS